MMKFRYIAVLIYFVLLGLALISHSDFLGMVLLMPTGMLLLGLELALGTGRGSITGNEYIPIAAGALQFFLMGLFLDGLISYFRRTPYVREERSMISRYKKSDGE
jgi:hypothetical protein